MRKTFGILLAFLLALPASAQLTATVQPGYVFAPGERPTTATLNALGQPSIQIAGTVSGTVGLTAGSVTGTHLADSVPDGLTINFNSASPRQLQIVPQSGGVGGGVSTNQINSNVCGTGLGGGSGQPLYVTNCPATQITVGTTNTLVGSANNNTNCGTVNVGQGLLLTNGILSVSNFTVIVTNGGSGSATKFTSSLFSIATGLIGNVAHGLAGTPQMVRWVMVNQTADCGYSPGDEIGTEMPDNVSHQVFQPGANGTSVWVATDLSGQTTIAVNRKDTGVRQACVLADWKVKCYAVFFP